MDGEKKPKVSPRNGQPVPTNPDGRPKGVPNKATTKFKEALNTLFEKSSDDMVKWLEEIERPEDRFAVLAKFVDLLYPRLARSDNTVTVNAKETVLEQIQRDS